MTNQREVMSDLPIHPGETLANAIEEHGLTQAKLAALMGRPPQVINEIVRGKKNITSETAFGLELVFGVPAAFWVRLQARYDITVARAAERSAIEQQIPLLNVFRYNELVKRGWVERSKDKAEQVRILCKYLGVASLHQHAATHPASFRVTGGGGYSDEALAVWLRKGELDAINADVPPFDEAKFRSALLSIREMTVQPPKNFAKRMAQLCATAGVALVFVPELPKVGANGVTRWLSAESPMIQLNLKGKRADIFWFTFFHEAGHVLQPRQHDVLHYGKRHATDTRYEAQADQFASDLLIPPDRWRAFRDDTRRPLTTHRVTTFARTVGIHPGIVVGRLQHERAIRFSEMNHLRRPMNWSR